MFRPETGCGFDVLEILQHDCVWDWRYWTELSNALAQVKCSKCQKMYTRDVLDTMLGIR
jgi:hypothetical protein